MPSDKVIIRTSNVLDMLKQGKTREQIREHYGLSKTELKDLFQHPKLKGRKTHKAPSFKLVDDLDAPESEEGNTRATTGNASSGSTTSTPGTAPERDSLFARRNEDVSVDDV